MSQTREPPILRHRNNHIPDDIVLNILAKLPVKSILRFRISGFGIPHDFPSDTECAIAGSCNGILCIADCGRISTDVIYLWNPSIRKFKRLPSSCLGKTGNLVYVTIGFAYHSQNNDYKVVRISCSFLSSIYPPVPQIEVYTLSTDSWRRVGISLRINNVMFNHNNLNLPIPLVSGALHWMACIIEENRKRGKEIIVSFDVNTEKFRELALPLCSRTAHSYQKCLALFKGKLAFITFGGSERRGFQNSYSVWVMREYGVIESWNKLFVVPLEGFVICFAFTQYGSLLLRRAINLVNHEFKLVLVDTATQHEKDLEIQDPNSCVATFMESLALLDGANMISY
uniref:Uncharacterized protein n=1 Tax=Fagus sylvatica TaxID=28930 RepID=A0A2N9GJD7_FAGSY